MHVLRNILRHRLRSALTLLGVAVGVALYVSLMTINQDLGRQVDAVLDMGRVDIMIQAAEGATVMGSRIDAEALGELAALPEVAEVSGVVLGTVRSGLVNLQIVVGLDDADPLAGRVAMVSGRLFDPDSETMECVLGQSRARKLNYQQGGTITLRPHETFRIAGIYVTGSQIFDDAVVLPMADARRLLHREDDVNLALLRLAPGADAEAVVQHIQAAFPKLSAIRSAEVASQDTILRTMASSAAVMSWITLAVAVLVVANTMLMAVTERTRELGVLMALGWSRSRIMGLVASEACLICLVGGILGLGLGWAELTWANASGLAGLDWVPARIGPAMVLQALGVAVGVGLLASLAPAWQITRLSPCEAIRHE